MANHSGFLSPLCLQPICLQIAYGDVRFPEEYLVKLFPCVSNAPPNHVSICMSISMQQAEHFPVHTIKRKASAQISMGTLLTLDVNGQTPSGQLQPSAVLHCPSEVSQ